MGGAAGHIQSPWECLDLTFGEIKDIVKKSLEGNLDNASEKIDGVNIMITYKNGAVYIARSVKQLKNDGEESIRWDKIGEYMKTPESKEAYTKAAENLNNAFTQSKASLNRIFKEGKIWLNAELLTPNLENIIPYGMNLIKIHSIQSLNFTDVICDQNLDVFLSDIESFKGDFSISRTTLPRMKSIGEIPEINSKIDDIMEKDNLNDLNTIGDYLSRQIGYYILSFFNIENLKYDVDLANDLINRWVYDIKDKNIKKIVKNQPVNVEEWIRNIDDHKDDIIDLYLDPIVEIFNRVGIAVLQNAENITCVRSEDAKYTIIRNSLLAIESARKYTGNKRTFLETQIRRIEQAGGLKGVAPIEGIVFKYKGRILKLTGIYLPILKIISFFRFGRDK